MCLVDRRRVLVSSTRIVLVSSTLSCLLKLETNSYFTKFCHIDFSRKKTLKLSVSIKADQQKYFISTLFLWCKFFSSFKKTSEDIQHVSQSALKFCKSDKFPPFKLWIYSKISIIRFVSFPFLRCEF